MKFSVIIPIYKAEAYLEKAVRSVLNQTYSDYEIILIDDGSPDKCPLMCDRYSAVNPKIRTIHQQNAGVSIARNNGIGAAKGDIICFLDADDEWVDTNLEELNAIYNKFPQIGSASTARFEQMADGSRKEISFPKKDKYIVFDDIITKFKYIRTSTYSVKRSVLLSLDELFAPSIKRGEDVDLILRVGCHYNHGFVNIPLAVYNVGTLFNSDNVSVRTYFHFWKFYNYNYPNIKSLNICTTGLLRTTLQRSISQRDFAFAVKVLMKMKLIQYIYYKYIKRS